MKKLLFSGLLGLTLAGSAWGQVPPPVVPPPALPPVAPVPLPPRTDPTDIKGAPELEKLYQKQAVAAAAPMKAIPVVLKGRVLTADSQYALLEFAGKTVRVQKGSQVTLQFGDAQLTYRVILIDADVVELEVLPYKETMYVR